MIKSLKVVRSSYHAGDPCKLNSCLTELEGLREMESDGEGEEKVGATFLIFAKNDKPKKSVARPCFASARSTDVQVYMLNTIRIDQTLLPDITCCLLF